MSNWYVRKPQSLEQRRTVEHHVGLCRALKADIAMFNIRHGSRFRNRPDKTFPLSSPQCQYTVEGPRGPNNFCGLLDSRSFRCGGLSILQYCALRH